MPVNSVQFTRTDAAGGSKQVAKRGVVNTPGLSLPARFDRLEMSADEKSAAGWKIITRKWLGRPVPTEIPPPPSRPNTTEKAKGFFGKIGDAIAQAGRTLKALPAFVYPSIRGANAAEKEIIIGALDRLPLKDATSVHSIYLSDKLVLPNVTGEVAGLARNLGPVHTIQLSRPWLGDGVVIHEVGHTKDFSTGLGGIVGTISSRKPFGVGPYVTGYARTNHWEDFAESYEAFHNNPQHLRNMSMAKYNAIQASEKQSLLEKAFDNKPVREAGKAIGDAVGRVPFLREALQVTGFVLGPLQINKGYNQYCDGYNNDNAQKRMDGKMNMAAGMMYTFKPLAVFGLVTDAAHAVINRSIKKGNIEPQKAEKMVNDMFKPITRPIGTLAQAIGTFKLPLGPSTQVATA